MASTTIHLQTANTLETDSLLNACGASYEDVAQFVNSEQIREQILLQLKMHLQNIDNWNEYPTCQRQICTMWNFLTALLYHHSKQLNNELPIYIYGRSMCEWSTPGSWQRQYCTFRTIVTKSYVKDEIKCCTTVTLNVLKKRWRIVQYLTNQFSNKWKKEYAQLLQSRCMWPRVIKEVKVNYIVIVKEQNLCLKLCQAKMVL